MDAFGNTLTETTFTEGELGTIYRSFSYDENGNHLAGETDARGNVTRYDYNPNYSLNEETTDRLGNKTQYVYDDSDRITDVISKNADGVAVANVSYSYDTFDNLTEIVRGDGLKYVLKYNAFHNLESIGINGKTDGDLITYTYKEKNGILKEISYANGDKMSATYNGYGQMISETWTNASGNTTAKYIYAYDGQGNIVRSIDILAKKMYNYLYNDGTVIEAVESKVQLNEDNFVTSKTVINTVRYVYDSEGKLTKKRIISANGEQVITYKTAENESQLVKTVIGENNFISTSKTDSFGRKEFDELQLETAALARKFEYLKGEATEEHIDNKLHKSTPTTQLVSKITFQDGRTIEYEYDAEERITKVSDSIEGVTEYTYDVLGQLLTETKNGQAVNTMTYDNYGNILTKNGVSYSYDTVWKDKLISVGSQSITYDAQGNPLNYLGHTLEWEKGRQLKRFDSIDYSYNANGIRTSKTVDNVQHDFYLDGGKILSENWNFDETTNTYRDILVSLYDNEESVCGIVYNGTPFYFQKNLQGDIIAITDKDGETVARYTYDAWGVCTVDPASTNTTIANLNPYRYRGYYYDSEIGMYYLQSRYYDPNTGRFVNGDDTEYIGKGNNICAYNLFHYCENEPICRIDILGTFWITLIVASVALVYLGNNLVHSLYNQAKAPRGFIFNQNTGKTANLRFGFFKSSYNGCGWIATYNALILLGKKPKAEKIISEYELTGAVLCGVFGIQPYAVTHYFRFRGYKVKTTYSTKKVDSVAKKYTCNILFYWHSSGAHYVACYWDGKKFIGYNTWSNSSGPDNLGSSLASKFNSNKRRIGVLISISKK